VRSGGRLGVPEESVRHRFHMPGDGETLACAYALAAQARPAASTQPRVRAALCRRARAARQRGACGSPALRGRQEGEGLVDIAIPGYRQRSCRDGLTRLQSCPEAGRFGASAGWPKLLAGGPIV
jgi:hypothetical protein